MFSHTRLSRRVRHLFAGAALAIRFGGDPTAAAEAADVPARPTPARALALADAIELALAHNPSLQAAAGVVRAETAAGQQAAALPNPTLDGETEDLAGSGRFDRVSQPQTTVRLSQLVILGGDRAARMRATAAARDAAVRAGDGRTLDVRAEVASRFLELQAAQALVEVTADANAAAARTSRTVGERVAAGFASPVDEVKAQVAAADVAAGATAARATLTAARLRLAATWGDTGTSFARAAGDLPPVTALPRLEDLLARRTGNPDVARFDAERARRTAEIDVERGRAVPDVTLSAGYRRFHDTDSNALVVGVSVPLPLFDRHRGAIDEAAARAAVAAAERDAADATLVAALAEAWRELAGAHAEATSLDAVVLPGAEHAWSAALEGYAGGKFGLLDVLDAQRTLLDARSRRLQRRLAFHLAAVRVARLAGDPVGTEDGR